MEFTSLQQLYRKLIPAFNVKKRLIMNSKYKNITNENIWKYLRKNVSSGEKIIIYHSAGNMWILDYLKKHKKAYVIEEVEEEVNIFGSDDDSDDDI